MQYHFNKMTIIYITTEGIYFRFVNHIPKYLKMHYQKELITRYHTNFFSNVTHGVLYYIVYFNFEYLFEHTP